ncbi:hypothetical protein PRIPAC_85455 [Pristionchus pacificus]|uniref:MFS domain-containing protein n=1 Tax=Pristionchus pacificus TaxID=54126 RepID=A0A2A6BRY2_PRIPA|nr:hypothetical protein PRIPAC_85455 [Pristionchus pacificus]|eukprot:PDM68660.1 hypothetical protein PRIPAC_46962 [Pristionchus pacificus]
MENGSKSHSAINKIVVVILLTSVLFLTAIDSYGIDVVPLVQSHFNISGAEVAVIRTSTSAVNTATLGVMWIAGEAVGRRSLYILSLITWIALTLLSISIGSKSFLLFVILRSLGAAASAVLGVLSPVLAADLFRGRSLGIALMAMSACEIVSGATIAVIYSSLIISSGLPWQAGLLPAPVLSLIPLTALVCLLKRALFWLPSMILSAWTLAPEAFMGLSYPSVTALNSVLILAGNVIGMPIMLSFAQSSFQSWYHGTGLFSGRAPFRKAYPIVVAAGGFVNAATFAFDALMMKRSFAACLVSVS